MDNEREQYEKKRHREMGVWTAIALLVGGGLTLAAILSGDINRFGPVAALAFFTALIIGIPLLGELIRERKK